MGPLYRRAGNVGPGAGNNSPSPSSRANISWLRIGPRLFRGEMVGRGYATRIRKRGSWLLRLNNPNGTLQRNFHRFPSL